MKLPNNDAKVSNELYIGVRGSGTLTIKNGGYVYAAFAADVGRLNGSTGTVTVTGAGSQWMNSSDLYVGSSGSGTLTIQNGGAVSNGKAAHVGNNSGSTGIVTVTGAGSAWSLGGNLDIGGNDMGLGGAGSVTVSTGGQINATGNLELWMSGTLAMAGGSVNVAGNADIQGMLSYDISGSTADRLTGVQAATLDPLSTLNIITSGTAFSGATYDLIDYQTLSGTFGTILNLPSNYTIDYGSGSQGSIELAPMSAPEPSTFALLGAGAASLLAYAWRRRKRSA